MRTKSDITPFYRGGRSAGEDLAAGDAHGLKSLNPVSDFSVQRVEVSNSSAEVQNHSSRSKIVRHRWGRSKIVRHILSAGSFWRTKQIFRSLVILSRIGEQAKLVPIGFHLLPDIVGKLLARFHDEDL